MQNLLFGYLLLSSGSKYQMEYCKIGMMRNRIKELDDMFKGMH